MPRFLLALVLPVLAGPQAQAQGPAPTAPPRRATTWEAVDQPMSALLNGGFRLVSATGPSFTLERGGKYVACEIRPAGGLRGTPETTSTCHRVNWGAPGRSPAMARPLAGGAFQAAGAKYPR